MATRSEIHSQIRREMRSKYQGDELGGAIHQLVGQLLVIGNEMLHVHLQTVLVEHIVLAQLVPVMGKKKRIGKKI